MGLSKYYGFIIRFLFLTTSFTLHSSTSSSYQISAIFCRASKIFQAVSATYGRANCYLLGLSTTSSSASSSLDAQNSASRNLEPENREKNCLTSQHQDRLQPFVEDYVERILIPWAEINIRTLNDRVSVLLFGRLQCFVNYVSWSQNDSFQISANLK